MKFRSCPFLVEGERGTCGFIRWVELEGLVVFSAVEDLSSSDESNQRCSRCNNGLHNILRSRLPSLLVVHVAFCNLSYGASIPL